MKSHTVMLSEGATHILYSTVHNEHFEIIKNKHLYSHYEYKIAEYTKYCCLGENVIELSQQVWKEFTNRDVVVASGGDF